MFFESQLKIKISLNSGRKQITGILHKNQHTFRPCLAHSWNETVVENEDNQNTNFMFKNFFSPPERRAVYEMMWKSMEEPGRPPVAIWRMRAACWTPKATDTHPEYIIIAAFPL